MAGRQSDDCKERAAVHLTTNAYLAIQLINQQLGKYKLFVCQLGALPLLNKLGICFKKLVFQTDCFFSHNDAVFCKVYFLILDDIWM